MSSKYETPNTPPPVRKACVSLNLVNVAAFLSRGDELALDCCCGSGSGWMSSIRPLGAAAAAAASALLLPKRCRDDKEEEEEDEEVEEEAPPFIDDLDPNCSSATRKAYSSLYVRGCLSPDCVPPNCSSSFSFINEQPDAQNRCTGSVAAFVAFVVSSS